MMNPELKTKWLAALRSGEYQQARAALIKFDDENQPSYCCLGLLEVIAGDCPMPLDKLGDYTDELGYSPAVEDSNFDFSHPEYGSERGLSIEIRDQLAQLNDGVNDVKPLTFAELADHIESRKDI